MKPKNKEEPDIVHEAKFTDAIDLSYLEELGSWVPTDEPANNLRHQTSRDIVEAAPKREKDRRMMLL